MKLKASEIILIAIIIITVIYLIFGDTGVLFLKGPVSSTVAQVRDLQGGVEEPMGRLVCR